MAPKRKKNDEPSQESWKDRKKQRTTEARTIVVQFAAEPSGSGQGRQAATNGEPSKTVNSMEGLPSVIRVEEFAEARAFEINAMQDAMKSAGANATHRVWQTLPRHLRRRAASHDVRRVPAKLRDKARAEMDPVTKKKYRKPQRGKDKRIGRTEDFLKRQANKTWLETHVWHAKRMHMEDMWGYRLAVTPTEKSFRPSHRASIHGSILHDASYEGVIELRGPQAALTEVLQHACDPQGVNPGAVRFSSGSRVCDTHIYRINQYPHGLIGPVVIMWRPALPPCDNTKVQRKSKKGKGKEPVEPVEPKDCRAIWLRCHPQTFEETFSVLSEACSLTLQRIKDAAGNSQTAEIVEIELADLRGKLNIFELVGPKSSQVIRGALTPVKDERPEFQKFWTSLGNLLTPGSVPRGMIVGFRVQDPRLDFPPKNAKPEIIADLPSMPALTGFWPTAALANCRIWEDDERNALQKPKYKKKDIDDRRSHNPIPGTKLEPLIQDNRIPVLLIQNSLEPPIPPQGGMPMSSGPIHGWTLVFPKGWGMPFLSSLTHTGSRVGGQKQCQTQRFESGCTHFPRDYVDTVAYEEFADDRAKVEEDRWSRKPPAKRPSWGKLDTPSPWKPDWQGVLGLRPLKRTFEDDDLVETQRNEIAVAASSSLVSTAEPWVLRGADILDIIENTLNSFDQRSYLFQRISDIRSRRKMSALSHANAEGLFRSALVMVRLNMPWNGAPEDSAIVYMVEEAETRRWVASLKQDSLQSPLNQPEASEIPEIDATIGYITTGSYSLTDGKGHAIGAIPLPRLLEMKARARRMNTKDLYVKVRNREAVVCMPALLYILS